MTQVSSRLASSISHPLRTLLRVLSSISLRSRREVEPIHCVYDSLNIVIHIANVACIVKQHHVIVIIIIMEIKKNDVAVAAAINHSKAV